MSNLLSALDNLHNDLMLSLSSNVNVMAIKQILTGADSALVVLADEQKPSHQ